MLPATETDSGLIRSHIWLLRGIEADNHRSEGHKHLSIRRVSREPAATGSILCVPDLLQAFNRAEGIMRLTCRRRPVSDPLCPREPGMRLGLPAPDPA